MSYVEDNLMPNEKILFSAKVSPAIFISPFIILIIGIVIFIKAIEMNQQMDDFGKILSGLVCLISIGFIIATFYLIIDSIITIITTEFAITNKRLIAKTGFVRRNTIEMLLNKIESASVNQSILGRILKFGTITITGTGGTQQRFRAIVDPMDLRKKIYQVLEYINNQYDAKPQALPEKLEAS